MLLERLLHLTILIGPLVLITCTTAFIVLLLGKIGLRDYLIEHSRINLLSKLMACDFCLCFWISLALSIILVLYYTPMEASMIFVYAICSTPISRFIL